MSGPAPTKPSTEWVGEADHTVGAHALGVLEHVGNGAAHDHDREWTGSGSPVACVRRTPPPPPGAAEADRLRALRITLVLQPSI